MARIGEIALLASDQSGHVQRQQKDVRECDTPIEIRAPEDTALTCNVELAQFGVNQRQQRWEKNVGRKDNFINFVPEGMAVASLDTRVRQVGEDDVGNRVGHNRPCVSIDIDLAE